MSIRHIKFLIVTYLLTSLSFLSAAESVWKNSPLNDPNFFPITVWLQGPHNAAKYKAAGINTYVGLYDGPTEEHIKALEKAEMYVICHQNEVGLAHKDSKYILGWMHGDEPDNAQSLPGGKGYGPPILPEKIAADYKKVKEKDPTRPVLLNLGQGVAWDKWVGRGTRTNHPEDYAEYMKGGDIVSFDIYPVAHDNKDVSGKLWMVPGGVERLINWGKGEKIVWNCIECTRIGEKVKKATPNQVKAEVWMSIIAGSRGIIYFVHEWQPKFNEHALLDDPEMLKAVTALNAQIKELAPVLNSTSLKDKVTVNSENKEVPVTVLHKEQNGAQYLFSVGVRDGETKATFKIAGVAKANVEVIGENRKLSLENEQFTDAFKPYEVHLYKITP